MNKLLLLALVVAIASCHLSQALKDKYKAEIISEGT